MKTLPLLLLLSTNLVANNAGMYGAPWATRPRPETTHVKVVDQSPSSEAKRALTDRIWKPGVMTVGLLSAVAGGVWYLRGQEASPVDLSTQGESLTEYTVVNLFSETPTETHVQVWQEGHSKLDWKGELNGSTSLNLELAEGPAEILISSDETSTAELIRGNKLSLIPFNQTIFTR